MNLEEARETIRDPGATFVQRVEAASVLSSSEHAELSDLLRCLHYPGLPAELAACALYSRTGRPRPSHDLSVDADDWVNYLAKQADLARAG
jgi:hypothetical protein